VSVWSLLAPPPASSAQPDASRAPPRFSVIVAAYDVADVIADALESAFAQTLPPHEVIVCDDGSTDDLDAALEPYRSRIRLLRQPNGGEAAAKNAAARAATGDFLVVLDADDTFEPERLAALAAHSAARPDLDVLTTDAILEVDGVAVRRCYTDDHRFAVDDQRSAILERNFVFGLVAVRRARFLELGGFDESIRRTTDWDLWVRLILEGGAVGLVDAPLARYRLRRSSLSADRLGMAEGGLRTLEKAAAHPALTASDRRALARGVEQQRRKVRLAAARHALAQGTPDARRLSLDVARDRGVDARSRWKALVAAIAPRAAQRRLAARQSAEWEGAGGVRVPLSPPAS
jgi:glycosyl transferase family 2